MEEPMRDSGPYQRLVKDDPNGGGPHLHQDSVPPKPTISRHSCWWSISIPVLAFLALLFLLFIKWAALISFSKDVNLLIKWITVAVSPSELAATIFASLALFPAAFLEPTPSMWIAGIAFGYELGVQIIIPGIAMGVSLPYFITYPFRSKIQRLCFRNPTAASIVRLACQGNWFQQFRTIVFIRISPFPYRIFNYFASSTKFKYSAYLVGSLVGAVPDIFTAIYSGILMRNLADGTKDQHPVSLLQIIIDNIGLCSSYTAMLFIWKATRKARRGRGYTIQRGTEAQVQQEEDSAQ